MPLPAEWNMPDRLAASNARTLVSIAAGFLLLGCAADVGAPDDGPSDALVVGGSSDSGYMPAPPCLAIVDEFTVSSYHFLGLHRSSYGSWAESTFHSDGAFRLVQQVARGQCTQFDMAQPSNVRGGRVQLSIGMQSWGLTPNSASYYSADLPVFGQLDTGLPVRFTTTGDVVRAHSVDLLVPPYVLVGINGDTTNSQFVWSTRDAVTFDWTPTDAQVYIALLRYRPAHSMMCIVDGRQGRLVWPAGLLAELGPGASVLWAGGTCRNTVQVGGQTVLGRVCHGRQMAGVDVF